MGQLIQLFNDKQKTEADKAKNIANKARDSLDAYKIFIEAMVNNRNNKDRLAQERNAHNKKVTNSYGLKK